MVITNQPSIDLRCAASGMDCSGAIEGVSPNDGGFGGLDGFDDIINEAEGMSQPETANRPMSHPREPATGVGYASGRRLQAAFQPSAMSGTSRGWVT